MRLLAILLASPLAVATTDRRLWSVEGSGFVDRRE
jgi:hypothetical protein